MKTSLRKTSDKLRVPFLCLLAAGIVTIVLTGLYWWKGYAPFGNNSLVCMDAEIQYLDFFAYLKDVLSGKSSIAYVSGKMLGGTGIALFSYYLSSPFNLLVVFFEKQSLHSFFDLVVLLKLAAAAATFCYFIQKRFSGTVKSYYGVLLAASYALMSYSITQSSNIMWLDGVYMLPLMLLGVWNVIYKRKCLPLIVFTGLSILFNWYSAGINCIYTGFWFILEYLLFLSQKQEKESLRFKSEFFSAAKTFGRYAASMAGGVALSACLFLPTIAALGDGKGHGDWELLTNTFLQNAAGIIQNFTVGSISGRGSVSLYCGSLALLGCFCYFTAKNISVKRKSIYGLALAISALMYCWQPFFFLFSMFKSASSYWYRYAYVSVFLLVFIAADYFSQQEEHRFSQNGMVKNALIFSGILLTLSYVKPVWPLNRVYYTVAAIVATAVVCTAPRYIQAFRSRRRLRVVSAGMVVAIVCLEIVCNTSFLMDRYHTSTVEEFQLYTEHTENLIHEIQQNTPGFYRISQTVPRGNSAGEVTANYNESLAYNYSSITGYSSAGDSRQQIFLDRLGYKSYGETPLCVVNTSLLAADSLLGVKYIISPNSINGLTVAEEYTASGENTVYENPYVLPIAVVYPGTDLKLDGTENSFEYQNALYSQLLGEEANLYTKLDYQRGTEAKKATYQLNLPAGNYAVYGNILSEYDMNAVLHFENGIFQKYSQWLSPSVFYIPTEPNQPSVTVVLDAANELSVTEEQFYALDLDRLKAVTDAIKDRDNGEFSFFGEHAVCRVSAQEGDLLYIAVPYHQGWTITKNGKEIDPDLFGECMLSIPLDDGENVVELKYKVPMLKTGITVSAITLVGLVGYGCLSKRIRKKKITLEE